MESSVFKEWLEAYGRAWRDRNPRAAAELYTEGATYQVTPFSEPLRGRAAIFEYWKGVAETERDIEFEYEILAVRPEAGIARWRASFVRDPPGLATKLDGIFVIALDAEGRCEWLKEWWHKEQH